MHRPFSAWTAISILTLLIVTSCVPITPIDNVPRNVDTDDQIATDTASEEAEDKLDSHHSSSPNVADLGFGRASTNKEFSHLATDGDTSSIWSAGAAAPQWFSVVLDDLYLVDTIELIVTQAPAGKTTHEIWLDNGSGVRTLYKRFRDIQTQDGQTLSLSIDPPRPVTEVKVVTLDSPSWVAWREVRILGTPVLTPEQQPAVLKASKYVVGFDLPVQVTNAGDGTDRLFVVEQKGRIRIIEDGAIVPEPFLNISHRISCCRERGLLNVAFPPGYADRQHFYVSYTDLVGDTVISRFRTTADPNQADPDSEEILLVLTQPDVNHNGGRMAFGPRDGYLYIGSGDGGIGGYPDGYGQRPDSLLGHLLRIDVESGVMPYRIPEDNPFVHTEGYRPEIWAVGLRNPWGFAFDSETGDLFITDTGHADSEEVNYQPASSEGGENYGWPIMEGNICFPDSHFPCTADGQILPVAEYDHLKGCAIVGGAVYRGVDIPSLQGTFLYADLCTGRIWGLTQDGEIWRNYLLISGSVPASALGNDEEGNVYVAGYQDGAISRITER